MAMIVVSFTSLHFWLKTIDYDIKYVTSDTAFVIPAVLFFLSFTMVFDVKYKKIRGLPVAMAGSAILIMAITLLVGLQWPEVGLAGSLLFILSSAFYLISPLADRSEGVWGATKRFGEDELIEIDGVEENLEEEDYVECTGESEVK
jgi:phosphatidylserine synthase